MAVDFDIQTARIAEAILARVTADERLVVAIAGPPGAGKSTVAEAVLNELARRGSSAVIVPMDGFHLDNSVLQSKGLLSRKGSPETFDLSGFTTLLERIRQEDGVAVPTFDRALDRAVTGTRVVAANHQIVLVEGNYLLLDEPGWRDLADHWDFTVYLAVSLDILEQRLTDRWLHHGMAPDDAYARAMSNDIPNARRVDHNRLAADLLVH